MRTGIVLTLAGVWLILRTVTKDANGNTLVDRILSHNPDYHHAGDTGSSRTSSTSPAGHPSSSPRDTSGHTPAPARPHPDAGTRGHRPEIGTHGTAHLPIRHSYV